MLYDILAIIAGFFLLIWSADKLVAGAATVAKHLGIPPLIDGITIVGFGTSAPEIMVASIASLDGSPSLAIGNAIGSNIANITLVFRYRRFNNPVRDSFKNHQKGTSVVIGSNIVGHIFSIGQPSRTFRRRYIMRFAIYTHVVDHTTSAERPWYRPAGERLPSGNAEGHASFTCVVLVVYRSRVTDCQL